MSVPWILNLVDCPVDGCPYEAKNPGRLRENFMFRHWKSKMAILQEIPEPLPWCDSCGMHIHAEILFKHWQPDKYHKLTERRLQWMYVEMAERCGEMEFSLDGEEGDERVENVPTFRYLGRPLDKTDDDWKAVRWNIMRVRLVWGRLGTMIQQEGAEPKVSIVWVIDVGTFVVNGKDGRRDTHRVPVTDHGKASEAIRRRDMGDAGGGWRTRGSRNPVGKDLHRETEGNRGAVGGATSLI